VRVLVLALLALLFQGVAVQAQTRQTESSISIERSVGVTTVARMAFAAAEAGEQPPPRPGEANAPRPRSTSSSAPAVIQVTGDPGRAYRINLPTSLSAPMGNATISQFHVWSQNAGDISETLTSHMDDQGQDTLRVTGVLSTVSFEDITAAMPVTVNYE
jgi:hypothetical protein